uniref:Phospholipase B-like n=1 Tax=Rhizochromulina marina TaxID=1034831 RepID=A0A7S2WE99_9STRA|mmetsp:Transcript_22182/g.64383  ORF Transcript_22182/g.64383 Transcript_22182/m.64383 type:complete len:511 (+) Transcript_22182:9-1541(+)
MTPLGLPSGLVLLTAMVCSQVVRAATMATVEGSHGRDALFFLGALSLSQVLELRGGGGEVQDALIDALECSDSADEIRAQQTTDDTAASLVCGFILARGAGYGETLATMSLEDQRNTLIAENVQRLGGEAADYQALSTNENARRAYSWYLEETLRDPLLTALENVTTAAWATYDTEDQQQGQPLDCLGAVRVQADSEELVGPYHASMGSDTFALYLATTQGSGARGAWTTRPAPGQPLFERASMGKLYAAFGGFLLLFEKNDQESGPCVAAAFYESWDLLLNGTTRAYFQSERTLGGPAEGTPNLLRPPEGDDVFTSNLTIGLHYYLDGEVDQQAVAVLQDFATWTTMPLTTVNEWVNESGYHGKVGAREAFHLAATGSQPWIILEAQVTLDAWDSWRILVGDGLGYMQADIKTAGASSSLANPSVRNGALLAGGRQNADSSRLVEVKNPQHSGRSMHRHDADRKNSDSAEAITGTGPVGDALVVTLFIPTEGSSPGEAGELAYPVAVYR